MRIVILDTGINIHHPAIYEFVDHIYFGGIPDSYSNCDVIGHGTAVAYCIHKMNKDAELVCFNVFRGHEEILDIDLIEALKYVYFNMDCDVINISNGVVCGDRIDELEEICQRLAQKGVTIISAFDNMGAISYPAAYDCVIGVDMSTSCSSVSEYEYVEGNCINIRGKGTSQTLPWSGNSYETVVGCSFAAGYISGIVSKIISSGINSYNGILNALKAGAQKIHLLNKCIETRLPFEIGEAIIVPFNKEMHSLVKYGAMRTFALQGVYSYKYTGLINKCCSEMINGITGEDYIIKNIEGLDWRTGFDTVIVGHLSELSNILKRNLKKEIIELCIKYHKNLFCLDTEEITVNIKEEFRKNDRYIYSPSYSYINLPKGRFGKMHVIGTPVLGVFGTSSIQGKFTLQMELKRRLISEGYSVGHLATEATGELLGADYVFPFGYASSVYVKGIDAVIGINDLIHKIEREKKRDIILAGSQSLSVQNNVGNIAYYPCCQTDLLYAIDADAIVLCVNYTDDDDYIERTIKHLESANGSVVIGIVLYPCKRKNMYSYLGNQMEAIPERQLFEKKLYLQQKFNRQAYLLGNEHDLDSLYDEVINYFA